MPRQLTEDEKGILRGVLNPYTQRHLELAQLLEQHNVVLYTSDEQLETEQLKLCLQDYELLYNPVQALADAHERINLKTEIGDLKRHVTGLKAEIVRLVNELEEACPRCGTRR